MKLLDANSCYRALKTHDARFDGRFFIGVTSTGIYCRPICTVKTPKRENCRFFPTAATAEARGFRPCLRCRPELAPGNSILEVSGRLAQAAAALIENGFLHEERLRSLAVHLGVTDRHLRRVFHHEYGVSLVEYAQTQRLLIAKRLLTDTSLAITEVALTSGFASLRRFNALFKERYRLKPSDLRKRRAKQEPSDAFQFSLAYRPPYNWPFLLAFLAERAIPSVESVAGNRYIRSVSIASKGTIHHGWIDVSADESKASLYVRISASLSRLIPIVLARVKRLFDVDCDSTQIEAALSPTLKITPGLRVPGAFDGFEMAARAILGQQVSVKAATTLAGRIATCYGQLVETPYEKVTATFPNSATLATCSQRELSKLGLTQARTASLLALARAVEAGQIRLDASADVATTIVALKELPGVGEWTAQYIAMRALSWPDAFPHTDLGIRKALGLASAKTILATAEGWKPWRAYATMSLWQSLQHKKGA